MYSQYEEEQHILAAVGDLPLDPLPRFLDIGAWEPIVFSNTRALFERGWGGLVLGPSPSAILKQIAEYGDVERVQIAALGVGCVPGGYGSILEFQATDDCVGTVDREFFEKWKGSAKYYG